MIAGQHRFDVTRWVATGGTIIPQDVAMGIRSIFRYEFAKKDIDVTFQTFQCFIDGNTGRGVFCLNGHHAGFDFGFLFSFFDIFGDDEILVVFIGHVVKRYNLDHLSPPAGS